jgi:hypothetical protein
MPAEVSETPQILALEKLISTKLSSYLGRGTQRSRDYSDVVELIQANSLPRDFGVDAEVQEL